MDRYYLTAGLYIERGSDPASRRGNRLDRWYVVLNGKKEGRGFRSRRGAEKTARAILQTTKKAV